MTVSSQKKTLKICILELYFFSLWRNTIYNIKNYVIMYISSVVVVLAPKSLDSEHLATISLVLSCTVGCTLFHAVEYVSKHPLIKPYLNKYVIINLTFRYSEL